MALINTLDQQAPVKDNAKVETATVAPVKDNAKTEEQKPKESFAGRFGSVEDLEKGYLELNKMQGKTGQEIGDLRGALEQQGVQMQEILKGQNAAPAEAAIDYDGMQATLAKQYEDGDIDFPTYARESNSLTAESVQAQAQTQIDSVLGQANDQFQQTLTERDDAEVSRRFHDANPEFVQLQESGAFEKIKSEDEFINDDYQAYLKHQATQAYVNGKSEATKEIAGSEPAATVASSPGSAMKNETPVTATRSATKAELFSSGLAAFNDAAGG